MTYTLNQLAADIRAAISQSPGSEGRQTACAAVAKALADADFIAEHLADRAPGEAVREVLYEDPETGFCICGHVHAGPAHGAPHDHGSSWAIYGQASGETEMTDWTIVDNGSDSTIKHVKKSRTYVLKPGDVRLYDIGDVHSPSRAEPVKLIRIEGANLDHVTRSDIAIAET